MSLLNRKEFVGGSDTESSASSNESSSSGSCCTRLTGGTTTTTTTTTSSTTSSNLDAVDDLSSNQLDEIPMTITTAIRNDATDESNVLVENARDLVITRSQSIGGQQCDKLAKPTDSSTTAEKHIGSTTKLVPSTSTAGNSNRVASDTQADEPKLMRFLRYTPSPSSPKPFPTDTNNNKGGETSSHSQRSELFSSFMETIPNKSISSSKLTIDAAHQHAATKSDPAKCSRSPNVCDCLAQDCQEKEHSNRRQFIEHYYNSRTRLPSSSSSALSSLNINTPLNRLSECDAITKRLLSSPIRGASKDATQSPERRKQVDELDKSRRASLGNNALSEQVASFTKSRHINSLEQSYGAHYSGLRTDGYYDDDDLRGLAVSPTSELDLRLKHSQGRSLSVCHEETQKPHFRNSGNGSTNSGQKHHHHRPHHHSSNLNRTVSLACDSSSSRRLLTIIPLFGCDITVLEQFMKFGLILPPPIDSAVDYILAHGIDSIGIFRKSGVKSRILTLRRRIEANQVVKLDELNEEIEFSIYDIADLVKMWLRELKPVPIMTKRLISLISDHMEKSSKAVEDRMHGGRQQQENSADHANICNDNLVADLKKQIKSSVTPTHRALFSKILSFFSTIASHSETNQMTSQNLAICLTPSLCSTGSDQDSIISAQKALKYCLDNYRYMF